jgi:hypothetical protein
MRFDQFADPVARLAPRIPGFGLSGGSVRCAYVVILSENPGAT